MEETQDKNLIIGLINKIAPPLNRPNSFNLTDVLDYTPDSLGPIYERFLSPKNRGVGFQKTVRQDFDDFEGLGKGQIIISDDKEKGVVTKWSPYMGDEFYKEENRKGLQAEFAMNFPLHVFPWLAMATGAKTLVTRHQQNPTKHVSGRTTTLKPGDLTPDYGSKGKTYDSKTDQVRTGQPGITRNQAGIPVDMGQNQAYVSWLAKNPGGTEQQWKAALTMQLKNKIDGNPDPINWMDYGYDSTGRHSEPEQVKRAYRVSEEMGIQVSQDLNQFYKRVNAWVSSQLYDKKPTVQSIAPLLRSYPFYWINPQTQKVYKIAARSNKLGDPRFTLESHSRRFLEGQQSSPIQKKNVKYINQIRTELNRQVKADYTARQSELVEEINRIDTQINYELTHKRQAYSAKGSLAALMNRRNSTVQELENLLDGEYYLEHGYYLASEKIRNRVKDSKGVPINDSTEYQLGNAKNISIVYDVKNLQESLRFREVKNLFEFVLDTKLPNGEYKYPNLVVNYSPNRDGTQYIIRIEELDTVRVENGMLIGGSWRPDGTISDQPFKQFNYLVESDKIKSTDDVLEWLRENKIEDRVKNEKYKGYLPQPFHIRQNVKPMISLKEFRQYIQKQTKE